MAGLTATLFRQITCLNPHPRPHTIISELDAFLFDAEDGRGLSRNTLTSYRCDLAAAAIGLLQSIAAIILADIEAFLLSCREPKAKHKDSNLRLGMV
jgi:hypothetical protein